MVVLNINLPNLYIKFLDALPCSYRHQNHNKMGTLLGQHCLCRFPETYRQIERPNNPHQEKEISKELLAKRKKNSFNCLPPLLY